MVQVAWSAVRTKDSYFQALFWRPAARLGGNKAIWAVAHRMLRLLWKVMHDGVRYIEYGLVSKNANAQNGERTIRTAVLRLERFFESAV